MKPLSYRILLRREPEEGYTVIVPSLPGCVTCGDTIEKAIEMAKEAIKLYIESLKEHDEDHQMIMCSSDCSAPIALL